MGLGRNGAEPSQGGYILRLITTPVLNRITKLVTTDEKKTVIAEFHRAHHFTRREKPRLEVQAAGMDMLDYIILTFAFAENKRRERERRLRSSGGGGGS